MLHLNLDVKFSTEVLVLYTDFVKFIVEEVGSHMQATLNIPKSFPIIKSYQSHCHFPLIVASI